MWLAPRGVFKIGRYCWGGENESSTKVKKYGGETKSRRDVSVKEIGSFGREASQGEQNLMPRFAEYHLDPVGGGNRPAGRKT